MITELYMLIIITDLSSLYAIFDEFNEEVNNKKLSSNL